MTCSMGENMKFDWWSRLLRIFRRQECEGSAGAADLLVFPIGEVRHEPIVALAPMEPAALPDAVMIAAPLLLEPQATHSRHLAAQLQSVGRLNQPKSRARPKPSVSRTTKPKPVATTPVLKRAANVQPGVVLLRTEHLCRRSTSAEIVDLAAIRRERLIELDEPESFALCC